MTRHRRSAPPPAQEPVRIHGSVADFGRTVPAQYWPTDTRFGFDFAAGMPKLVGGDKSLVDAIERARDSARGIVGPMVERAMRRWHESGSAVSVSRYLRGDPKCMARRIRQLDTISPVRIVVSASAHWSFSLTDLGERAGMVVAIIEALSAQRPVELWGCVVTECRVLWEAWPVPDVTDLAAVGAAIGPAALRGPGIGSLRRAGSDGPHLQAEAVFLGGLPFRPDIFVPGWVTRDGAGSPDWILRRFLDFPGEAIDGE